METADDTLLSLAALAVFPLYTPDGNRKARFTDGGRLAGVLQIRNGTFAFRTRLGVEFEVPLTAVEGVSVPKGTMARFGPAGHELICTVAGTTYRFGPTAPLAPDTPIEDLLQAIKPQQRWKSAWGEWAKGVREIVAVSMFEPVLGIFGAALDSGLDKVGEGISRKKPPIGEPSLRYSVSAFLASAPKFAPGEAFRERLMRRETAL